MAPIYHASPTGQRNNYVGLRSPVSPTETDQERIERLEAELAHLRKVSGYVVNCWAAAEVGEIPQMMNASIPALRDALQARSKGESASAAPAEPQAPCRAGGLLR